MKQVIGIKVIKIVSIIILTLFSLFSFSGCNKKYKDEVIMLSRVIKYYDNPNNVTINTLDKYEINNYETYYYVDWQYLDEEENHEWLVVYGTNTQIARLMFFQDMEYGFDADVKKVWDEVQDNPTRSFTESEISSYLEEAIELFNEKKAS